MVFLLNYLYGYAQMAHKNKDALHLSLNIAYEIEHKNISMLIVY